MPKDIMTHVIIHFCDKVQQDLIQQHQQPFTPPPKKKISYIFIYIKIPQQTPALFWKASSWHSQLAKELPVDDLGSSLPAFLRSDSEEAFASAAPKGGLVPTGLAGAQQGRRHDWEGFWRMGFLGGWEKVVNRNIYIYIYIH